MPKTYRVGIIGATGKGNYGHGVDVAFLKVPNVQIVAIADANADGRLAAAKRCNVTNSDCSKLQFPVNLDRRQLTLDRAEGVRVDSGS